jgi:hypothetical protein
MKQPLIVKTLFDIEFYKELENELRSKVISHGDSSILPGRCIINTDQSSLLKTAHDKTIDIAKKLFEIPDLLPSYALFAHYETIGDVVPYLRKHKDTNACTYIIDMCLYQSEPWDIYIEGTPYTLHPNQALAFYGEDQEHWRGIFPDPSFGFVGMVFFCFVKSDHWFYAKGKEYIKVINGDMTEEEWVASHQ